MPRPYWRRLDFDTEAISIVRTALKTKLWQGNETERLEKLRILCWNLSAHLRMPCPEMVVTPTPVGPHYIHSERRIVLDKPSLVSMLHELAHALLDARGEPQNEEFPRAWSLGLYFRAAPRLFEAARRSGHLMFTNPEE